MKPQPTKTSQPAGELRRQDQGSDAVTETAASAADGAGGARCLHEPSDAVLPRPATFNNVAGSSYTHSASPTAVLRWLG